MRPLVLDGGDLRRAGSEEELELALTARVDALERRQRDLAVFLALQGLDLPVEWTDLAQEALCS